jgi:hypothetical protein
MQPSGQIELTTGQCLGAPNEKGLPVQGFACAICARTSGASGLKWAFGHWMRRSLLVSQHGRSPAGAAMFALHSKY